MSATALALSSTVMSDATIKAESARISNELGSRIEACAARAHDPDEARQELWAFCWRDFQQAARRGRILPAGYLVWFGWRWLKAGRTIAGHESVTEPLSPLCQRRRRARIAHLSVLATQRHINKDLPADIATQLAVALTTRERDDPAYRAATRLDWSAFARRLPIRLRKIVRWLAVGASKSWIAKRLGISNGRVSQLLDTLARPTE